MKLSDLQHAARLAKIRSDLMALLTAAREGNTTCHVAWQGDRFEAHVLLPVGTFQNAVIKATLSELHEVEERLQAMGVEI